MNLLSKIFSSIFANKSVEGNRASAIAQYPSKEKQSHGDRGETESKDTLKIENARIVTLPFLPYGRGDDKQCSYSRSYWEAYNKGYSYYCRGWYSKAKETFLTIYNENHLSEAYFTHLLRTYRKLYTKNIEKKKYKEALSEMAEMFYKCQNTTAIDIRNYNMLVDTLTEKRDGAGLTKKEIIKDNKLDCEIDSQLISLISETKKPRGFNISQTSGENILRLQSRSHLLPKTLPHIEFSRCGIKYLNTSSIPYINDDVLRFSESSNRSCFLIASRDLFVKLYSWDLTLQNIFDARTFCNAHYSLREIAISADLSLVVFTSESRAYILDRNFYIVSRLRTPPKEGWERVTKDKPNIEEMYSRYLRVLGIIQSNPTASEIKSAYRKLALVYHPDKNPNDPRTTERFREITEAYEVLSDEDARRAFAGLDDEEEWIQVLNTIKLEAGGMTFSLQISMGGDGQDWIYGLGFAPNSKQFYLGCYSGKVYRTRVDGIVDVIYTIPEDRKSIYGRSNPVDMVFCNEKFLYIITHWYIYILNGDEFVEYLQRQRGTYKWFKDGFLYYQSNVLNVMSSAGKSIGTVKFKNNIRNLAFSDELLLVETGGKSFLFEINMMES